VNEIEPDAAIPEFFSALSGRLVVREVRKTAMMQSEIFSPSPKSEDVVVVAVVDIYSFICFCHAENG
jgi:hypothetical protein